MEQAFQAQSTDLRHLERKPADLIEQQDLVWQEMGRKLSARADEVMEHCKTTVLEVIENRNKWMGAAKAQQHKTIECQQMLAMTYKGAQNAVEHCEGTWQQIAELEQA